MVMMSNAKQMVSKKSVIHSREQEYQSTYRGYLFGQFRLIHEKRQVGELMRRRSKARMLLKWFLLNPGKLGSADEFIDLFWPELSPETSMGNFHVTMHYLRHILEPGLGARQESTYIHRTSNNFYWFQPDERWWTDVSDIQGLFDRAREYDLIGNENSAAFCYRKIASYCNLGFLPEDDSEDWLLSYQNHYEHLYSHVLMRLIQLYTQRNDWEEVLEYAYQALRINPYHEIATQTIVNVHLQQGNISIAQRRLEDFWASLKHDLGLYPGKELQILRERIRTASSL